MPTTKVGCPVFGARLASVRAQGGRFAIERFIVGIDRDFQPAPWHPDRNSRLQCPVHLRLLLPKVRHVQRCIQLLPQRIGCHCAATVRAHRLQAAAFCHCFQQQIDRLSGSSAVSFCFQRQMLLDALQHQSTNIFRIQRVFRYDFHDLVWSRLVW